MNCHFTFFPTVFQSYKDDERLIMKGYVQSNPVYGWEDFALNRFELGTAISTGQRLTHKVTDGVGKPVVMHSKSLCERLVMACDKTEMSTNG